MTRRISASVSSISAWRSVEVITETGYQPLASRRKGTQAFLRSGTDARTRVSVPLSGPRRPTAVKRHSVWRYPALGAPRPSNATQCRVIRPSAPDDGQTLLAVALGRLGTPRVDSCRAGTTAATLSTWRGRRRHPRVSGVGSPLAPLGLAIVPKAPREVSRDRYSRWSETIVDDRGGSGAPAQGTQPCRRTRPSFRCVGSDGWPFPPSFCSGSVLRHGGGRLWVR